MANKLIKVHNQTLDGVVNSKRNNKLIAYVFCVCFIGMLFLVGFIYFKSLNLVHVVENNGNGLPTRLERKEQLIKASLQNNTVLVNTYINNINRFTVKEYLARARFLVSNKDLMFIYKTYKKNKYYDKAKEQGYEYKSEFQKFIKLDFSKKPYYVKYLSKTSVYDGVNKVDEFFIEAEGEVTEITPQFEETIHGFYFSNYRQTYHNEYNK